MKAELIADVGITIEPKAILLTGAETCGLAPSHLFGRGRCAKGIQCHHAIERETPQFRALRTRAQGDELAEFRDFERRQRESRARRAERAQGGMQRVHAVFRRQSEGRFHGGMKTIATRRHRERFNSSRRVSCQRWSL